MLGSDILSVSNPYFMSILNNDKNIPFVMEYYYSYLKEPTGTVNNDIKIINRIMINSNSTSNKIEKFNLSKVSNNTKTLIQEIYVSMNGITSYDVDITLNNNEKLIIECPNNDIITNAKYECTMLSFGTLIN